MRVFAGPNGSGKTTIMAKLKDQVSFGAYVNADDIEKSLNENGFFDLSPYPFETETSAIQDYFRKSGFSPLKLGMPSLYMHLSVTENKLVISPSIIPDSYIAADISEWIRQGR